MTTEQLEQQSRDAVIAYLQDSSVRLEFCGKRKGCAWVTNKDLNFDLNIFYYRIAQPNPWYRVALFNDGVVAATRDEEEEYYVKSKNFVKWLTNRIEYTNE